jgi:hypothetical protein
MQVTERKRKTDLPTVQFRVTDDLKRKIEDLVHQERTSIQALMEEAVDKIFVDRKIYSTESPIMLYNRLHPTQRGLLDAVARILESEDDVAKGTLLSAIASGVKILDSLLRIKEAKTGADIN